MKKRIDGKAILLGDNIDAEQILAHNYIHLSDPPEIARHLFEGREGDSNIRLTKGCILIAGMNFGGGQARPQMAIGLKSAGVACIIAGSFSRSFYRDAINQGIPLIESPQARENISHGESISIDFENCEIIGRKNVITFKLLSEIIVKILSSGGLISHTKKSLGK